MKTNVGLIFCFTVLLVSLQPARATVLKCPNSQGRTVNQGGVNYLLDVPDLEFDGWKKSLEGRFDSMKVMRNLAICQYTIPWAKLTKFDAPYPFDLSRVIGPNCKLAALGPKAKISLEKDWAGVEYQECRDQEPSGQNCAVVCQ